ncbi:hypothetical protein MBLNU230_g7941t1 [Neophaeotheca triangularis]
MAELVKGSGNGSGGMGDLEKELSCSICTEVLFQPLTLLDCLHTFCGSCLKEWFQWQAASASQNRRHGPHASPYTCPACRAFVRGTRPNATVTTLLEMFLKAHPERGKNEDEARELRALYKPGDDVLPAVGGGGEEEEEDSGDERLLAQVRELSMASVGERERRARRTGARGPGERRAREERLEHQPSLRSLVMASDADSQEMQEAIMAQIVSEGLLDGVDLEALTREQEEELTERIALAYQRRQRGRDRPRSRGTRSGQQQRREGRERSPVVQERARHHRRNESASNQPGAGRARPPVSRPHIFEQAQQPSARARSGRRSSSQSSPRTPRSAYNVDGPAARTPAARSATDLSTRPRGEEVERERPRSRRSSNASRRTNTDPEGARAAARVYRNRTDTGGSQGSIHLAGVGRRRSGPIGPSNNSSPSLHSQTRSSDDSTNGRHTIRPATSSAAFAPEPTTLQPSSQQHQVPRSTEDGTTNTVPSISCNRCEKAEIQHDLHYHCNKCSDGHYNICLTCYRAGQGCNHWFGFGYSALYRWQRAAPKEGWPPNPERPHILTARRYPCPSLTNPSQTTPEEGAFCERCLSNANPCYWHCTLCLEGAWGFCAPCVQRGHHCTHPLLPLAHIRSLPPSHHPDPTKTSFISLPHLQPDTYLVLPISTACDLCARPIAPNNTRFHCHECNAGNYDVCTPCYRGLVAQNKLKPADGPNGWRRCPVGGHRMAVLGFQDTGSTVGGQQLVTVREVVGGWALKEDGEQGAGVGGSGAGQSAGNKASEGVLLPPDGGVGLRCLALWSYFPAHGVLDEVGFPKNAEVREVELINADWGWGVYAGAKGLFPLNHVRVL